jgi:bla regulator protein BlaR1
MDTFLTQIAACGIRGSLMVVMLMLIDWIFREKISPRIRYVLSVSAIIFFILPVPGSLRWINLEHKFQLPALQKITNIDSASQTAITNYQQTAQAGLKISSDNSSSVKPAIQAYIHELDTGNLVLLFWLCGVAVFLGFNLIKIWRFNRHLKQLKEAKDPHLTSAVAKCKRKLGLAIGVKVLDNTGRNMPCVYGVNKPILLIPGKLAVQLSTEQLEHVLYHELCHIKRRDGIWPFVQMLICSLHWFNPFVYVGFSHLRRDIEFMCDDAVMRMGTSQEYLAYGNTIIRLLEYGGLADNGPYVLGTSILNKQQELFRRIKMISVFDSKKKASAGIFSMALCLAAAVFVTGANLTKDQVASQTSHPKGESIKIEVKLIGVKKDKRTVIEKVSRTTVSGKEINLKLAESKVFLPVKFEAAKVDKNNMTPAVPVFGKPMKLGIRLKVKPAQLADGRFSIAGDIVSQKMAQKISSTTAVSSKIEEKSVFAHIVADKTPVVIFALSNQGAFKAKSKEVFDRTFVIITISGAKTKVARQVESGLERIVFPALEVADFNLRTLLFYLEKTSKKLDPVGKGAKFKIQLTDAEYQKVKLLKFSFKNMPLPELARYIAQASGLKYEIHNDTVIFKAGEKVSRKI